MPAWLRPRLTLRSVLVGQFLLTTLIAALVVTLLLVFWRLPQVRQQTETEQRRAVATARNYLQIELRTAAQLAQTMSRVMAVGGDVSDEGLAAVELLLSQFGAQSDLFHAVYVLDEQLRIRWLSLPTEDGVRVQDWQGNDFSGLLPFLRDQGQLDAIWSDQYRSPVTGRPVVSYSVPQRSSHLMVELAVDRLAQVVREAAAVDGLAVLVLDSKGEVVAAPDMRWAETRRNLSDWPLVQAARQGLERHGTFDIDGQRYQGTATRVEQLGWVVLAGYPAQVSEATIRSSAQIAFITFCMACGAGVLLLGGFASLMQRRLDRLVAFAADVSNGRYDTQLPDTGVVELQRLSGSLTQMARQIESRQGHLQAIVSSSPNVSIQWYDREGRIQGWNNASEGALGYTREEALGHTLHELGAYTEAAQAAFLEALRTIEATGEAFGPFEGTLRGRNGQEVVFLSTTFAVPVADAEPLYVCMDVDITEIKRKEAEIRANQEKFNLFFHATPVAVAVLQWQDGQYLYADVNRAWEQLLGYRRDGVVGTTISPTGILRDRSDAVSIFERLQRDGAVHTGDVWVRRADGSEFLAEVELGQVDIRDERLIIYSLHDVTEERRLERELRELNSGLEARIRQRTESLQEANTALQRVVAELQQAQSKLVHAEKLASLGSLVAGVAHELNTPIGNGLMAVSTLDSRLQELQQALQRGLKKSDLDGFLQDVQQVAEISTRNLQRASELISSFKQVAVDQSSSQRRAFTLDELVREIMVTLQPSIKRTHIACDVEVPTGLALDSYPGPLGQVLTNLIQNALVHAFEGRAAGTVRVQAQAVAGERWRLTVQDDGVGIPAEHLHKVFDPFFTTRLGKGGSGLGLHIVYNIVTGLLGGTIEIERPEEGGIRFVIECPCQAPGDAQAA